MEILVCVKRVPDTAENEIEVKSDGTDIERDDLVYSVNEWDNYAVEEAIQIRDNVGGSVTVFRWEMKNRKRCLEEKWQWVQIKVSFFQMMLLKDLTGRVLPAF